MATNNQILLSEIIKRNYSDNPQYKSEDSFFEFFAAQQVLKAYDLSDEEIEQNLTGNGLDGGCDGIYIFANRELLHEDDDVENFKQDVKLTLCIIQAKNITSFGEEPFEKWKTVSTNLLALDKPCRDFKGRYNEEVLHAFSFFKDTYIKLIRKRAKLNIEFKYVSKGTEIHPNVKAQSDELKALIKKMFPSPAVTANVEFIGADKLMEILETPSEEDFYLKLSESPITVTNQQVYIALVNLADYYSFITDSTNELIKHIFESNIRDYQGHITVNKEIQDSLEHSGEEDFWWLNNGVTIVASSATIVTGKELRVSYPEVVNGLQTSNEIYNYFSCNPEKLSKETRNLLVRVIVPQSEDSRDKIIFATNSQTSIPKASLRATDSIHRQIELFFKPRNLFYDRRKNYYKNQGKKSSEIVSISFLAQCLMTVLLQRPDFARARPSTLLTDDVAYKELYIDNQNLQAFFAAAYIGKKIDFALKSCGFYSIAQKSDILFYVLYVVVVRLVGKTTITNSDLADIDLDNVDNALIKDCADYVFDKYNRLGGNDKVAKGSTLIAEIKRDLAS